MCQALSRFACDMQVPRVYEEVPQVGKQPSTLRQPRSPHHFTRAQGKRVACAWHSHGYE